MSQTILENAADHISDSAHQASRATRTAADAAVKAMNDGAEAVRRVTKQSSDVAEEFFDDTTRLIRRQPIPAVAAIGALALTAGVLIGWMMQSKRR